MLAEEDKHAEEKSPMDGAWYKRKNNPGEACGLPVGEGPDSLAALQRASDPGRPRTLSWSQAPE